MRDISHISTYESGVIQSAAHRVLTRIKTDFLSRYDLTPTQWFVIGYAYDAGDAGIALSRLMEVLDTSMPFVTTTVNLLESKGIIQKLSHPEDSRVKIAQINPAYVATAREIEEGLRQELRDKLYHEDHISRDELATYIKVLYKITESGKSDSGS